MAFELKAVQRHFFNRQAVARNLDKKKRSATSKFGAFVRQRARTSIRKRKKVSEPGRPPSSHVGTLKKLIYFAWDERKQTVVVGPVPFGEGVAPKALEHGGPSIRVEKKEGKVTERRRVMIRARPFMQPALQAELPKFASLFRG